MRKVSVPSEVLGENRSKNEQISKLWTILKHSELKCELELQFLSSKFISR